MDGLCISQLANLTYSNQCIGRRLETSHPVKSLHVDAHKPCLSVFYAAKTMSFLKHPIHDAVFGTRYMEMSDTIHTFDLCILKHLPIVFYHLGVSNLKRLCWIWSV